MKNFDIALSITKKALNLAKDLGDFRTVFLGYC